MPYLFFGSVTNYNFSFAELELYGNPFPLQYTPLYTLISK